MNYRTRKHRLEINMTPVADLFLLLLLFYMVNYSIQKPKAMEIVLPETSGCNEPRGHGHGPRERLVNLVVAKDAMFWYYGHANLHRQCYYNEKVTIFETSFKNNRLRNVLLSKNKMLALQIQEINEKVISGNLVMHRDSLANLIKETKMFDRCGPIVLIKLDTSATYSDFVNVIDEMAICNIARYTIVDLNYEDEELLKGFRENFKGYRAPVNIVAFRQPDDLVRMW